MRTPSFIMGLWLGRTSPHRGFWLGLLLILGLLYLVTGDMFWQFLAGNEDDQLPHMPAVLAVLACVVLWAAVVFWLVYSPRRKPASFVTAIVYVGLSSILAIFALGDLLKPFMTLPMDKMGFVLLPLLAVATRRSGTAR
ncbi:MAG: hypothetical protein WDN72_05580 [Alphaproteobacteria bacterium]